MNTKKDIDNFLSGKKIAFAGISRKEKHFSRHVWKDLRNLGYDIAPVNPNAEEIDGVKCFKDFESLPNEYDSLLVMTPSSQTDDVVNNAINKGIKKIWVQQGSTTEMTKKLANNSELNVVNKHCIYMFSMPKGIHGFHRFFMNLFGKLPK